MRVPLCLIGFGLYATGQTCSSYATDQCASNCACQRVACCCGTGCDRQGGTIQYNACVPANSPYEQWSGCPSASDCSATSGLIRTITPCVVPTPAPSPAATNSDGSLDIPFGTTFPMIGTQALSRDTWQKNVYMGTTMQFNPGAFWGYTDSYSVPNWNAGSGSGGGSDGSGGNGGGGGSVAPTSSPTPADATGRPCFSYSQPCPSGYYCKLNTGYNVQQKGTCQHEASDTWTQGAGKFTDSSYYTGLVHPPLVLDPDHDGPAPPGPGYGYGGSGGGYLGLGYNLGQSGAGTETCAPLATGAPVCGFKSFTGTCFCDTDCSKSGDCCIDYANFCGVLSDQYTGFNGSPDNSPAYSPPATGGYDGSSRAYSSPATGSPGNGPAYSPPATGSDSSSRAYSPPATGSPDGCDAVGQCSGLCGSSNPAIGVNGKLCYCDGQCSISGDCCCSVAQCSR